MNTKQILTLACTILIGSAAFAAPGPHRGPHPRREERPHRPEAPKVVRILDRIVRIVHHF